MPNTNVEFGCEGKEGTCLWCGRKLKVAFQKHEERFVEAGSDEYLKITAALAVAKEKYFEAGERGLVTTRMIRSHNKHKGWIPTLVHGTDGRHTGYRLDRYAPDPSRGYGYLGQGNFDTMYCGWQFGLIFAGEGHRLKAKE